MIRAVFISTVAALFMLFTLNAFAQSQGSFSATTLEQDSLAGSQEWHSMSQGTATAPTGTSSVAGCYSTVQNGQPVQICPYSGQAAQSTTGANVTDWADPLSAQSTKAQAAAQAAAQQAAAAAAAGAQGTTTPGSQQPYYNGNTTANGGTYNQQSNSQAQQRVVNQNQCYQAQALAQKCCSNPESCLRLSGAVTCGEPLHDVRVPAFLLPACC